MCSNGSNLLSLSCPLCCQTNFQTIEALKMSLIKVVSRPLKCPLCDEIVLGLDKLTIHLFAHSLPNDDQAAVVVDASPVNSTYNLKSVRKPKTVVPKNCITTSCVEECSVKTESTLGMTEPLSEHCGICNVSFPNEVLLKMHMDLVHELRDTAPTDDFKFNCNLCTKSFKMKGSLRIHLKVAHYGFRMKSLDMNGQKDITHPVASTSHQISETPPKYELIKSSLPKSLADNNSCDICGKSFTTKYFLKKHKRLHTGEQPYTCNICQKSFTFQQSYHKHLLYHNDEKPHICGVCNRAFKELSTLHNHERIHSGEKPFKCETCGKCFRQRVSYLVHRRIHTGVMPYCCTACNKTFRYKVSQRTHKCTAQPPGTVIRQTGDLLQKLLNNVALNLNSQATKDEVTTPNGTTADSIAKSLDDLVNESCNKMGLEPWSHSMDSGDANETTLVLNVPSPSEFMKNLCLGGEDRNQHMVSTINTESLKELLYDVKI